MRSSTSRAALLPKTLGAGILILLLIAPGALRSQASAKTVSDSINRALSSWNNAQSPGISVAVIKDGKRFFSKSFGMANIDAKTANNSHTRFWIASVTKQFTAAAIYALAAQHKMSLDSSIRAYMPELPALFQLVTVNQLIHHTSGIRDGFVLTALAKKPETEYTNENVLTYLARQKGCNAAAGERYEYNNAGYVLLATATERVSGQNYPAFLKTQIFKPLGMEHTDVSANFPADADMAEGYHRVGNGLFEAGHFQGNTYGSTGIVTTADDLIRWQQFLQQPSAYPALAMVHPGLLEAGTLTDGRPIAYAGGLEKFNYQGQTVYEHFGADEGFKADMLYFPDHRLSIIGLTNNSSYYDLQKLLFDISSWLLPSKNNKTEPAKAMDNAHTVHYYYDSAMPKLIRMEESSGSVQLSTTPSGYAAPYSFRGDTLVSHDPVPTAYLQEGDRLRAIDKYYHQNDTLHRIALDTSAENFSNLSGQYYSEELQTTYEVKATDKGLVFEFVPGINFDLMRINKNDFVFDYLGANFIQFMDSGFAFSREGCRKLVFTRR